jgi:hypothetical protein
MRLKYKLADRSNASSEVEYHGAWGQLIGEPGKGVKTIIEMVQATRLDCILGSAGHSRRALQVALNHVVSGLYSLGFFFVFVCMFFFRRGHSSLHLQKCYKIQLCLCISADSFC